MAPPANRGLTPYLALDLATADNREAIAIAKLLWYESLARTTEGFLKEIDEKLIALLLAVALSN